MILHIHKITDDDGWEILPDITDTPLWEYIDLDHTSAAKSHRQLATLYSAIARRENYYQLNTPTAYGNPDYSYAAGTVSGILQALDLEEYNEGSVLVIRKANSGRKVLIIDKLSRPESYYAARRENAELRREFGL